MTNQDEIRTTGDLAPAGKYYCDKCGHEYEHKDENQVLPNCPAEGIWTIWNTEPLKTRS
jgi:rubrerythrin